MKLVDIKFLELKAFAFFSLGIFYSGCEESSNTEASQLALTMWKVEVNDAFWSPKFDHWRAVTVNDVFDKFEGKYTPEGIHLQNDFKAMGQTRNAFLNFDLVTGGKLGIGQHHGPPWYDGLVYETIRGAADLLVRSPDSLLEVRIDGYIDRIVAAQTMQKDGYLNTYTQLIEPKHRWGFNGGMLRWQHDVYNAGMLVEAGVHYYKATGKVKLLDAAVKYANLMWEEMGPAPKKNVVPAHSGPEEALIKLYRLFRDHPDLKSEMSVRVEEDKYLTLAMFWIENRGNHAGFPHWKSWGDEKSEKWIRDSVYTAAEYGDHSRPSWGDYAQDSISVFQQKTIEGHAVRATLLATGITTAAMENSDPRYINTAHDLWDNMVGKRMFITGGVGAIARDEKFGADYYLPNEAYLETCAAVGAGFFSQRMHQLTRDGKYLDEFERVLYNNVLTGISLDGKHYTYQNPLTSNNHHRWGWHDCPCCPPMFLKMVSVVPDFIYATKNDTLDINLFMGSRAKISISTGGFVEINQETNYPWEGKVALTVNPEMEAQFTIRVRIPGWARGLENPFGLYQSSVKSDVTLTVNGTTVQVVPDDGYAAVNRMWTSGDRIELMLPMEPRVVRADDKVADLKGMAAISSGPLVYCLEKNLNKNLSAVKIDTNAAMEIKFYPKMLGGINVINGKAHLNRSSTVTFKAIPYFAAGNLVPGDSYRVWLQRAQ